MSSEPSGKLGYVTVVVHFVQAVDLNIVCVPQLTKSASGIGLAQSGQLTVVMERSIRTRNLRSLASGHRLGMRHFRRYTSLRGAVADRRRRLLRRSFEQRHAVVVEHPRPPVILCPGGFGEAAVAACPPPAAD